MNDPAPLPKETKLCTPCAECGMPVWPGEYHPYAACLMFKACHNSETVTANLAAVLDHGKMGVTKRDVVRKVSK
jgi:hypothetical protein